MCFLSCSLPTGDRHGVSSHGSPQTRPTHGGYYSRGQSSSVGNGRGMGNWQKDPQVDRRAQPNVDMRPRNHDRPAQGSYFATGLLPKRAVDGGQQPSQYPERRADERREQDYERDRYGQYGDRRQETRSQETRSSYGREDTGDSRHHGIYDRGPSVPTDARGYEREKFSRPRGAPGYNHGREEPHQGSDYGRERHRSAGEGESRFQQPWSAGERWSQTKDAGRESQYYSERGGTEYVSSSQSMRSGDGGGMPHSTRHAEPTRHVSQEPTTRDPEVAVERAHDVASSHRAPQDEFNRDPERGAVHTRSTAPSHQSSREANAREREVDVERTHGAVHGRTMPPDTFSRDPQRAGDRMHSTMSGHQVSQGAANKELERTTDRPHGAAPGQRTMQDAGGDRQAERAPDRTHGGVPRYTLQDVVDRDPAIANQRTRDVYVRGGGHDQATKLRDEDNSFARQRTSQEQSDMDRYRADRQRQDGRESAGYRPDAAPQRMGAYNTPGQPVPAREQSGIGNPRDATDRDMPPMPVGPRGGLHAGASAPPERRQRVEPERLPGAAGLGTWGMADNDDQRTTARPDQADSQLTEVHGREDWQQTDIPPLLGERMPETSVQEQKPDARWKSRAQTEARDISAPDSIGDAATETQGSKKDKKKKTAADLLSDQHWLQLANEWPSQESAWSQTKSSQQKSSPPERPQAESWQGESVGMEQSQAERRSDPASWDEHAQDAEPSLQQGSAWPDTGWGSAKPLEDASDRSAQRPSSDSNQLSADGKSQMWPKEDDPFNISRQVWSESRPPYGDGGSNRPSDGQWQQSAPQRWQPEHTEQSERLQEPDMHREPARPDRTREPRDYMHVPERGHSAGRHPEPAVGHSLSRTADQSTSHMEYDRRDNVRSAMDSRHGSGNATSSDPYYRQHEELEIRRQKVFDYQHGQGESAARKDVRAPGFDQVPQRAFARDQYDSRHRQASTDPVIEQVRDRDMYQRDRLVGTRSERAPHDPYGHSSAPRELGYRDAPPPEHRLDDRMRDRPYTDAQVAERTHSGRRGDERTYADWPAQQSESGESNSSLFAILRAALSQTQSHETPPRTEPDGRQPPSNDRYDRARNVEERAVDRRFEPVEPFRRGDVRPATYDEPSSAQAEDPNRGGRSLSARQEAVLQQIRNSLGDLLALGQRESRQDEHRPAPPPSSEDQYHRGENPGRGRSPFRRDSPEPYRRESSEPYRRGSPEPYRRDLEEQSALGRSTDRDRAPSSETWEESHPDVAEERSAYEQVAAILFPAAAQALAQSSFKEKLSGILATAGEFCHHVFRFNVARLLTALSFPLPFALCVWYVCLHACVYVHARVCVCFFHCIQPAVVMAVRRARKECCQRGFAKILRRLWPRRSRRRKLRLT